MEGPLEPNMGPSLADVLLCTFESTNAGFSSFSFEKTSVLRVIIVPLQQRPFALKAGTQLREVEDEF